MTTPAGPATGAQVIDLAALPPAKAVDMGPDGAGGLALSFACLLLGWSVRETSGTAAAVVTLHDGRDDTGQRVGEVALAAGASQPIALPAPGILCRAGLYAHVASGAAEGVLWVIPVAPGA